MNMEKTCLVFPRLILVFAFYSVTLLKVDTFQVSQFTLTADCSNILSKYNLFRDHSLIMTWGSAN